MIYLGLITMKKDQTLEEADQLVHGYSFELIGLPCMPGANKWSAKAHLQDDITEVLPYLNAELKGADYDHNLKVLIWEDKGRIYAFRPHEIATASVESRDEGRRLIDDLVTVVNKIWNRRHKIEPNLKWKELPSIMDIYKLLPKTNCKECSYLTCMAYAADLREGGTELPQCPHLSAENRDNLLCLFDKSV